MRRIGPCVSLAACLFLSIVAINRTSAVTYQTGVGVGFTFNPTLSINLSSADILIPNLAPGNSSDSNTITVTVNTNTAYGYTLNATVGEATNYNTRNLKRSDTDAVFSSIDYGSSLTSLTTDNTWGYSYKPSGQSSTWTTYSGLPLYNDTENVATLISTENAADSDSIEFKIGAKASTTQPAGDYKNVINFIAVSNPKPDYLYDKVAALSKGTLANNNVLLSDAITTPTSTNKTTDTSNSGVYEYDPTVYGVASDAANTHTIYFYRGILETNPGSYGSAGSANAYPNYVKLDNNTCWRIVRTTGSGGVKMIYNGLFDATNNTCGRTASDTTVAQGVRFATQGSSTGTWARNMAYVGYTYNNSITDSATETLISTIFGDNSKITFNNKRSNAKQYLEDTWYANNMIDYNDKLEANAGYCADRSVYEYDTTNRTTTLLEDPSTLVPYSASSLLLIYGGRLRSNRAELSPTYNCPRGDVDIYRYVSNSSGVGNELKYPVAFLTADEASFAGSGFQTGANNRPAYNSKSFLASGSGSWLLSPNQRTTNSVSSLTALGAGYLVGNTISDGAGGAGIRPAISLKPGTEVADGSGTATDPWTIK